MELVEPAAVDCRRIPAGGSGNDRLSGGAGADAFDAGAGNDTIDARDRAARRSAAPAAGTASPPTATTA
jgi:Ca2+-binding RTX toxin-like protein